MATSGVSRPAFLGHSSASALNLPIPIQQLDLQRLSLRPSLTTSPIDGEEELGFASEPEFLGVSGTAAEEEAARSPPQPSPTSSPLTSTSQANTNAHIPYAVFCKSQSTSEAADSSAQHPSPLPPRPSTSDEASRNRDFSRPPCHSRKAPDTSMTSAVQPWGLCSPTPEAASSAVHETEGEERRRPRRGSRSRASLDPWGLTSPRSAGLMGHLSFPGEPRNDLQGAHSSAMPAMAPTDGAPPRRWSPREGSEGAVAGVGKQRGQSLPRSSSLSLPWFSSQGLGSAAPQKSAMKTSLSMDSGVKKKVRFSEVVRVRRTKVVLVDE